MRTILAAALALGTLTSVALADEPLRLTADQMDRVDGKRRLTVTALRHQR